MSNQKFEPKFTINAQIQKNIRKADQLNAKHTALNQESLYLYNKTSKEVATYQNGFNEIKLQTNKPITKTTILHLHSIIVGEEKISEYRKKGSVPIIMNGSEVYNSSLAELGFVEQDMELLISWINTSSANTPPLVSAAITHYKFVKIHPFSDGNGRTARLLSALILLKGNYSLGSCYALLNYFVLHTEDSYYKTLDFGEIRRSYDVNNINDITPWIEYFCASFIATLKDPLPASLSAPLGCVSKGPILRTT